jgi:acetyl-CoA acetyltransferase
MMVSSRNPAKDMVAIAGVATTQMTPHNTGRSPLSLAAEASVKVIRELGLSAADIDGICGATPPTHEMASALGLPTVTWFAQSSIIPFGGHVVAAVGAVASGVCETVLAYHGAYRMPWNTASSLKDPFRRPTAVGPAPPPETVAGTVGYTAWASRYLYEYGGTKDDFGLVAVNDRSNAMRNPYAAMRTPMTMDDYHAARMIRWPLNLLDMDVPVDGADAFVITTPERARDLPFPPVLVHAAALGLAAPTEEDQIVGLRHQGQQVVVDALRAKSDFWIDDIDVYFAYDGFTIMTLTWIESVGLCGPGEAGDFLRQHWVEDENRVLFNGRVPCNSHGGALSDGGTQGSGHVREAVLQLQGRAGDRQVPNARRAMLTLGGFFFNAQGLMLQRA